MAGTSATRDGGDTPAVRRSWVPRTVAALFLGAGVYAGFALVGDVSAHAEETTATATSQTETTPPAGSEATDPSPADPDAAPPPAAPPTGEAAVTG